MTRVAMQREIQLEKCEGNHSWWRRISGAFLF